MEQASLVQNLEGKEVFADTSGDSIDMIRYTSDLLLLHRYVAIGAEERLINFGDESCLYNLRAIIDGTSFGFAHIPLYRNQDTGNWHVERVLLVPKGFESITIQIHPERFDPRYVRGLFLWGIVSQTPKVYRALHPSEFIETGVESGMSLLPGNNFTFSISRQKIRKVGELRSKSQKSNQGSGYKQGDIELINVGEISIVVGEVDLRPGEFYSAPNVPTTGQMPLDQSLKRGIIVDTLQAVKFRVLEMGKGKILDVMTREYMLMRGVRRENLEPVSVSVCNNCGHTEDYNLDLSQEHLHCRGCNKIANFSVQQMVYL